MSSSLISAMYIACTAFRIARLISGCLQARVYQVIRRQGYLLKTKLKTIFILSDTVQLSDEVLLLRDRFQYSVQIMLFDY